MTSTAVATPMRRRLAGVMASLVVLSAALLVIGTSLEHARADTHTAPAATTPAHHDESSESGEARESHETGESHAEHSRESAGVSGLETSTEEPALVRLAESPVPIAAVVVISLGLALAVWRRASRPVLAVTAAFTVVAGIFDVTEISHQLGAGRTGPALLAMLIAVTRLAALITAISLWRLNTAATQGLVRRQ